VKGTTKQALKDASEGTLMKETAEVTLKGASEGALMKETAEVTLKGAAEGTLMKETAEVTLKGAAEGVLMQGTTKGALRTTDKISVYWQQIIFLPTLHRVQSHDQRELGVTRKINHEKLLIVSGH